MNNEIKLNGIEYVKKDEFTPSTNKDGLEYCVIRTYSAGCFAGYVKERNGKEGIILEARRLWYWSGAFTLSTIAVDGLENPDECKFPCEVSRLELTEIIEVIPTTDKAKKSIKNVKIWKE